MIRRHFIAVIGLAAVVGMLPVGSAAQGKASTLDTAKAKAFMGEWILTDRRASWAAGASAQHHRRRRQSRGRFRRWPRRPGFDHRHLHGGRRSGAEVEAAGAQGEVPIVMTLTLKDGGLVVKQDIAGGQFSTSGTGKKKG